MQKLERSFIFFNFVITQTSKCHCLEKKKMPWQSGLRCHVVFGTHGTSFSENQTLLSYSGGIMTTTRFFVYGSFCEGMVHFSKIQNFVESSVFARVKATAYRLKVGFPAMVKGGSDLVPGQLIELKGSDLLLSLMDEFHGYNRLDPDKSLYSREEIEVHPEGMSAPVKAWIYFLNPLKLPVNATVISGGDWRRSMEEQPVLTSKLSDKQVTYIQRLGRSSGREIVPIDLTLYRELMNLELIVDKGRRLALSKLGQEVYRHLA